MDFIENNAEKFSKITGDIDPVQEKEGQEKLNDALQGLACSKAIGDENSENLGDMGLEMKYERGVGVIFIMPEDKF